MGHRTRLGFTAGFTLIEMMFAIGILALVMVMLAGSFHAVAVGKTHAEGRLAVDQRARNIMWQLTNEIRGAVQTPLIPSRVLLMGTASMRNGLPLDSITIVTIDPGHRRSLEGFGAEDAIEYDTTVNNPNHRGWYLLTRRQSSALLGIGAGSGGNPTVLADNLLSLHLRYFDGQGWNESWNSQSLPPGRSIPMEISIDLVMAAAGGSSYSLSTMVMVPMAFQQW
jgi:prepilin-type N-terminal cleavage/methylation domain-containing protein